MAIGRYLALLRGINVGGKNIIKMADLKACFEDMQFTNVATFIQSGNVVFQSKKSDTSRLESMIEKALRKAFHCSSMVVIVSHRQLQNIVKLAPEGFGSEPQHFRYDVVFPKVPLTPAEVLAQISLKEGVDEAHAGKLALYFSRLSIRATQSRLSRITALPIYQQLTIRNWNTTTKLLTLMDRT